MVLRWADRCIAAGVKPVSMSSPSIHRLQNRLGACRQFGEEFAAIRHKIRKQEALYGPKQISVLDTKEAFE